MDNIILGLLLLQSRTIYQLKERINKGLNLMYSNSTGSIQAAVKKLLDSGYINFEETVENGRHKKIYSITESGKQHFLEWINKPFDEQNIRCPELVKVYFMGFSDKKNRVESIEKHLSYLKEQYYTLNLICEESNNTKIPKNSKDIFTFQLLSACYGRDLYKFNIDWFENVLTEMKDGEI